MNQQNKNTQSLLVAGGRPKRLALTATKREQLLIPARVAAHFEA